MVKIMLSHHCLKFGIFKSALLNSNIVTNSSAIRLLKIKESRVCSQYSSEARKQPIDEDVRKDILPASQIPGLPTLPFFGNMLHLMFHKDFDKERMHKFYEIMALEYGPVFKIETPGVTTAVFFVLPEDVKTMVAETASNPVRDAFDSLKHIRDNTKGNFFQKKSGILAENHEEWKRVRSKVQHPIMKIQNVLNYLGTMDEISLDFAQRISEIRNEQQEVPDYFITELYKWALESIGTVALNKRLGCLSKNLPADSYQMKLIESVGDLFKNMQQMECFPLWKLYPTKSYKRMKECHDYILKIAEESVCFAEESMKTKSSSDKQLTVMETYLQTEGLTRTDIITFMTDLFIAGIDTTSHTLAFSLYLLSKNQDAQRKLQNQLDEVLGDGKAPITPEHIASLSYLKNCIKETLRLYPVALGIPRVFEKDTVINKYMIPKGWQGISINAVSGQDESNFSQPKQFIPERWQRDRPNGVINAYASLPFSLGTRGCIGRRISEQEMYTFLARICHRFNVEYHYEDLDPYMHVVLTPDKPLKFKFTDRN